MVSHLALYRVFRFIRRGRGTVAHLKFRFIRRDLTNFDVKLRFIRRVCPITAPNEAELSRSSASSGARLMKGELLLCLMKRNQKLPERW